MAVIPIGSTLLGQVPALLEGLGAEFSAFIARVTPLAPLALAIPIAKGIIDSIIRRERYTQLSKARAKAINTQIEKLETFMKTVPALSLSSVQDEIELSKIIFPKETQSLIDQTDSITNIINIINTKISQLEGYRVKNQDGRDYNNTIITTLFEDAVPTTSVARPLNTNTNNDIAVIAQLLFDLGIIDIIDTTRGRYFGDIGGKIIFGIRTNGKTKVLNVDTLIEQIKALIDVYNNIIIQIEQLSKTATFVITEVTSPTQSPPFILNPEGTLPSLETLLEQLSKGMIVGRLADLLKSLVNNATRTKNAEDGEEEQQKKRKRRRRKKKRKQNKKKRPKKIKMAWIDTTSVSKWIAKLTFEFPVQKDIESDDRGTLRVHIKGGGVIKFVRVKRGTFSVISSVYGTGYRIWSQFWKRRIVNRTVLSWFIKRINANDREIAIPQEINNKKVKYK